MNKNIENILERALKTALEAFIACTANAVRVGDINFIDVASIVLMATITSVAVNSLALIDKKIDNE